MVSVDGPGYIELFCWETAPGYSVHLLNYSNANAFHGWLQSVEPLGPQHVSMKLPQGVRVRSVVLLKSERDAPFHIEDSALKFTVPSVGDYEVAAVTVA
jgi:hypothetical protein